MSLAALIAKHKSQSVTPCNPEVTPQVTAVALGPQGCNPCNPAKQGGAETTPELASNDSQNPDALLLEIAGALHANPDNLYALLSADDIQDIADGENTRAYMLEYFRLMRADDKLPVCTEPPPVKATESPQSHMDSAKAWKPAH